jgi:hypothetical protein
MFRFYGVGMLECPRFMGAFNHYRGASPSSRASEFVVSVKPKTSGDTI